MPVTTVFADPADGYLQSASPDYSEARAGDGTVTAIAADNDLFVGQLLLVDYHCYEAALVFDTSSITDSHEIIDVDLELWLVDDSSDNNFLLRARDVDWGSEVTAGDWVAGGDLGNSTQVAFRGTTALGSTGNYETFDSEPEFRSVSNIKTGDVRLLVSSSRHQDGNPPGGDDSNVEFVIFAAADRSGTSQDPRLVIEHESILIAHTATGGTVTGGAAQVRSVPLASHTATGGTVTGGAAQVEVTNAVGQVPSNVVVEWDFNNDGRFTQLVERITPYLSQFETRIGRDWPSQLTGKAGPGSFRGRLNNHDDRFNHFNQDSPLNQTPYSLTVGRKLRVRTAEAADPDPLPLARDRFRRADGELGELEEPVNVSWVHPGGIYNDWEIVDERAQASVEEAEGGGHLAVVDVGADDYLVQIRLGAQMVRDPTTEVGNQVGVVFRFEDSDNYSLFRFRQRDVVPSGLPFELVEVTGGSFSTVFTDDVPYYAGINLGVAVSGDTLQLYIEGVPHGAPQTAQRQGATQVGMFSAWTAFVPPQIDEFYVWDRQPTSTEGVLWTGDVEQITSQVAGTGRKTASLSGKGILAKLATHRLTFPGLTFGQHTGRAVGKVLSETELLTPPGELDKGTIRTGPVALDEADAVETARQFEDVEFGFLYEAQEGWLGFDDRDARDGRTSQATFSDDPAAQFHYERLEPLDWRREIFNRVEARLAPKTPVPGWQRHFRFDDSTTAVDIGSHTDTEAGMLMLAFVACGGLTTVEWLVPTGWVHLTSHKRMDVDGGDDNFRIYARIAEAGDAGEVWQVATMEGGGSFVSTTWNVGLPSDLSGSDHALARAGWFGVIDEGVKLGDEREGNTPKPLTIPWAPDPTGIIAVRAGRLGGTVSSWGELGPDGYMFANETLAEDGGDAVMALQTAAKFVSGEDFEPAPTFGGTFSGFAAVQTQLVAVRGGNGDPPITRGRKTIVVDDRESQQRHRSVRSHINEATLFASESDAADYGNAVLDRHAEERPVVALEFTATKNAAYRAQAIRRRVGDRITLIASGRAGMGISGDFFIESIRHEFRDGTSVWLVTWELSPVE